MTLGDRPADDPSRPIEEWSDEELVAQFRSIKGELTSEAPGSWDLDGAPALVIEEEMKRRGLTPDREDLIPDAGPDPDTPV
ncbi:MAG TPA: hypothetical protein VFU96_00555 [Acidimicrobiia bacterium]|nr:hypothetical protein [Acidimicrobiia bacterium]